MSNRKAALKFFGRAPDVPLEDLIEQAKQENTVPVVFYTDDPDTIRRSDYVLENFQSKIQFYIDQKENHAKIAKNVAQAMQIEKEEKEKEGKRLKKELKKEKESNKRISNKVEDQKTEIQTLTQQLTQTKRQLSSESKRLEKMGKQYKKENGTLEHRLKCLEDEVQRLKGFEDEVQRLKGFEDEVQRLKGFEDEVHDLTKEVFEMRSFSIKIEIGNLLTYFIERCGGDPRRPGRVIKNLENQEEEVRNKILKHFSQDELYQYYTHIYKERTQNAHYIPSGKSLKDLASEAEKRNCFEKNKIKLIAKMIKAIQEESEE